MADDKEGAAGDLPDADLKIILLGDSAVGKSKLLERYLMNDFNPRQLSTYALTLYRQVVYMNDETQEIVLNPPAHSDVTPSPVKSSRSASEDKASSSTYYNKDMDCEVKVSPSKHKANCYTSYSIDYWDTAGQEVFTALHPSYYYATTACILCFDVTRKLTYTHLNDWYNEYNSYCSKSTGGETSLPPCILVANKIDVDYNVTKKEFKFASRHNLPFFFVSAADGTNVVKVFHQAIKEAINYKNSGGDVLSDVLAMLKTSTLPGEIGSADEGKDDAAEPKGSSSSSSSSSSRGDDKK